MTAFVYRAAWAIRPNPSRLLKKTHMLRCRLIALLQRTVSTPPLVDFSRASPLDLFEQPVRGFFSTLLDLRIWKVFAAAFLVAFFS